jgi:CelD/BcsL family acetyltransferase involved in cellulose biosynthesis
MIEDIWIHDINEFKEIRNQWDRAIVESNGDNPFLLSEFVITWWEINYQEKKLCIYILKQNENIIAGFPLYIFKPPTLFSLKRIQQIGDDFANLTEPFSKLDIDLFENHFLKSLKKLKNWDTIDLPRIRSRFLEQYRKNNKVNKFKSLVFQESSNASIIIDMNSEDFLMTVSSNLRNNVRKARKKAEKIGSVKLMKMEAPNDIEKLIDDFFLFSIETRFDRGGRSEFTDIKKQDFTRQILLKYSSKGLLDAHVLYFGEIMAAISFGYRFQKGFKWIFTTYNPDLQKISPGHTLIFELINYCYKIGDPYFDTYGGGHVFYKKQWCNKFDSLYYFIIFNNTFSNIIFYVARTIKLKILKLYLGNQRIRHYYLSFFKKLKK